MTSKRRAGISLATMLVVAWPIHQARAQCPDGTPPPCGGPRGPGANSVAVLYFDVRSADPRDSAFADGLTDAIIDELGADARLHVVSRFAVRRYRGVALPEPAALGRTLGAGTLVTGVLQRAGGEVQVRIELLAAATGRQLWREPYQGGAGDALGLERDIAQRVAASIGGQLAGPRPRQAALSRDTAAYGAYLRGNGLLPLRTVHSSRQAIAEYEQAVAVDPRFVSAWARMAVAYAIRLQWVDPVAARGWDTLVAAGMRAADRAVALDPRSGEAWAARAFMLMMRNPRTYAGVQDAFDRAFALAPRNAEAWSQYADFLEETGRPGRREAMRKALEYEPGRPITLTRFAASIGGEEGLVLVDSAIALAPASPNHYGLRASLRLALRGDTAGARGDLETAAALRRADGQDALDFDVQLALLSGDSAAARALVSAALASYRALPVLTTFEVRPAAMYALNLLRDRESAVDVLRRVAPRGAMLYRILNSAWAAPLRSDPRIREQLDASRPPWATAP